MKAQRKNGTRRTILLIDPKRVPEFFVALDMSNLSTELKAFIGVSLAGGCRASETLSIQRSHFQNNQIVNLKVLKKREEFKNKKGENVTAKKVYRSFDLHPTTLKYLSILCKDKRRFSKLFNMNRSVVFKNLVSIFGEGFCIHSFRHSHISYRLHVLKQSAQEVEERIKITSPILSSYNHINTQEREGIWG